MIRNDTFNNLAALCRRGSLPVRNSYFTAFVRLLDDVTHTD